MYMYVYIFYILSTELFSDVQVSVPKSFLFLVIEIILKNWNEAIGSFKGSVYVILSHSAVCSWSFIFPLLLVCICSFTQVLCLKTSDWLSLGLCTSYKEVLLCKSSNAQHYQPSVSTSLNKEFFIQYVAYNANHNFATVDGLNTFNSMEVIRNVAPPDRVDDSL